MADPTIADLPFAGQLKILLPPLGSKAVPLISEDEVKKIPYHLLTWLRNAASQVQDLGELTVISVYDTSQHLMIGRVVEWTIKGEEASFFANETPKVICDGESKAVPYDAKVHNDNASCRATPETSMAFDRETQLYSFSVIAGLKNLQTTFSRRLSSIYPVYVAELATLFNKVYQKGVYTPLDPDLVRFVCGRISVLRKPLAEDDKLLGYLRTCFSATDKFKGLIHYMDGNPDEKISDRAVEHVFSEVGKRAETKALLAIFVDKYLKIPADPVIDAPTGPADRRRSDDRTDDAMNIFQAIARGNRIVVAEESGTGALRSTRPGTTRSRGPSLEFRMTRGETLVVLPNESLEAGAPTTTRLVCNRNGDVGELSKSLRLASLQDLCEDYVPAESSSRRAPLSPASESDKNAGRKRRRKGDSYRPA